MTAEEKIEKIWTEIKKVPRYSGYDCVTFFEMNNYTFILRGDVDKIWKEDFEWIKKDVGRIGEFRAIRLEKFDPNDIDNYFDDLMYRSYFPIRIVVKEEYWTEKDYVKD